MMTRFIIARGYVGIKHLCGIVIVFGIGHVANKVLDVSVQYCTVAIPTYSEFLALMLTY